MSDACRPISRLAHAALFQISQEANLPTSAAAAARAARRTGTVEVG